MLSRKKVHDVCNKGGKCVPMSMGTLMVVSYQRDQLVVSCAAKCLFI